MNAQKILMFVVAFLLSTVNLAFPDCKFTKTDCYRCNGLFWNSDKSAYIFSPDVMTIDADGAPNAYHPNNIGLDYLKNAGYPNDSNTCPEILVADPQNRNRCYIQTSGDYPGFFVSKTSLVDNSKSEIDPNRYVNASKIPYIALPGCFYKTDGTGKLGDIGFAINFDNGLTSSFIFADVGPACAPLGEVSIALAERLTKKKVDLKIKNSIPTARIGYVFFPYSYKNLELNWPFSQEIMDRHAKGLLKKAGGIESVNACFGNW